MSVTAKRSREVLAGAQAIKGKPLKDDHLICVEAELDLRNPGCDWGFDLRATWSVIEGGVVDWSLRRVHYCGYSSDGGVEQDRVWNWDHPDEIRWFERLLERRYSAAVDHAAIAAVTAKLKGGR